MPPGAVRSASSGRSRIAPARGRAASLRLAAGSPLPGTRSEVVPATADRVAGHAEQGQDRAHDDDDDADRPDNRDFRDEADDEKNDAENNQRELLTASGTGSGEGWSALRGIFDFFQLELEFPGYLVGFSLSLQPVVAGGLAVGSQLPQRVHLKHLWMSRDQFSDSVAYFVTVTAPASAPLPAFP